MNHPLSYALPLVASLLLAATPALRAQTPPQHHVHEHGHEVMPFDLENTVHVFRMTETGGIQRVVLRGDGLADPQQLALIRQHLQHEAMRFAHGDYGDPAQLHGAAMPGLADLRAAAARIHVRYRPLANGAEIEFRARDIRAITAVHRWFGAQLSEHGADARAE